MRSHFDTRFFVAFMPQDQVCLPDERETVHGIWISPEQALKGNHEGEITLSPPTLVTLQELLGYKDLSTLQRSVKTRPWGEARFPPAGRSTYPSTLGPDALWGGQGRCRTFGTEGSPGGGAFFKTLAPSRDLASRQ